MQIQITPTTDAYELAQLNEIVQTWHHAYYPKEFKPFDLSQVEKAFKKLLQEKDFHAFIAKSHEESIGYVLCHLKRQPESAFQYKKTILNIDQIAVVNNHRKSSVGKMLLDAAINLSQKEGINEIQLDFWSGNITAEKFFLRNGFKNFNYRMKRIILTL